MAYCDDGRRTHTLNNDINDKTKATSTIRLFLDVETVAIYMGWDEHCKMDHLTKFVK